MSIRHSPRVVQRVTAKRRSLVPTGSEYQILQLHRIPHILNLRPECDSSGCIRVIYMAFNVNGYFSVSCSIVIFRAPAKTRTHQRPIFQTQRSMLFFQCLIILCSGMYIPKHRSVHLCCSLRIFFHSQLHLRDRTAASAPKSHKLCEHVCAVVVHTRTYADIDCYDYYVCNDDDCLFYLQQ